MGADDGLRERIAVTIYHAASQWDDHPWDALAGHIQALYLGQADEVIQEIGLRQAMRSATPTGPIEIRYVTDWKADDENAIYEARKKCGYE
jgi:hypothetical protein